MQADLISDGYCQCGCGGETQPAARTSARRGTTKGQPQRFIAHHNRRKYQPTWAVNEATGCWEWQGQVGTGGYGRIYVSGWRYVNAHRWVYEQRVGAIPSGLELDHLCRNRACVNPAHLELVTSRENSLRGIGPAAIHAATTHCPKGHQYSGENLYICPRGTRRCRECRRESMRATRAR